MKIGRNTQRGAAIVIAAVTLPIVLAGLGLVIDNGQAFDMKRRLQKAADAAAIAAAQELRRGNVVSLRDAAYDGAERNGVALSDTAIEIYNPPKTGKRAGNPAFVEVEVRKQVSLYFMRAFSSEPLFVEARAIAGVLPRRTCVMALNENASAALQVGGSSVVNLGPCGVHVNSDSSSAARSVGGGILEAASVEVVGGYTGSGFTPPPLTGVDEATDPLAEIPPPDTKQCLFRKQVRIDGPARLRPGVYCGGIEVTAQGVATLDPGVYVLAGGGLTLHGGGTIKGDEVMFYNTTGPYQPIWFSGNATAQLTAPKAGPYAGILFYTDRSVSGGKPNQITGTSDSFFTGAIYMPTVPLNVIGTADMDVQKMLIIADTIQFQGNVDIQAPTAADGLSPFTLKAALVY